MTEPRVDLPSSFMVLSFTANIVASLFSRERSTLLKEIGIVFLATSSALFLYVIFYLRSGFFGETMPTLDHVVTEGPYKFCRHPLYLSFITMVLGIDIMMGSILGIALTFLLSAPSAIYRAKVEEKLLGEKFGEEWERYSKKVGFLFPRISTKGKATTISLQKQ